MCFNLLFLLLFKTEPQQNNKILFKENILLNFKSKTMIVITIYLFIIKYEDPKNTRSHDFMHEDFFAYRVKRQTYGYLLMSC